MGICESFSFFIQLFKRGKVSRTLTSEFRLKTANDLIDQAKATHKKQITFPVMCSQCDVVELCVSKWFFPNYIAVLYESGGAALFVKKRADHRNVHDNPTYSYPVFFSSVTDMNNYLSRLKSEEAEPFSHHRQRTLVC